MHDREPYGDYFTFFEEVDRVQYMQRLENENMILQSRLDYLMKLKRRPEELGILRQKNMELERENAELKREIQALKKATAMMKLGASIFGLAGGEEK